MFMVKDGGNHCVCVWGGRRGGGVIRLRNTNSVI